MKTIIYFLLFFFPTLFFCNQNEKATYAFEFPVSFGDPFIMLYENTYYAYGTNADNGIEVYTSEDLEYWTKANELALKWEDSWGNRWYWAPEIYYVREKSKFFMYYTADEHICVATSDSPLGPFKQEIKKPMLESEKAIDNSLFIDNDGTPYLYFDRFNNGLNVWVAQLKDDLKTLKMDTPALYSSFTKMGRSLAKGK